MSTVTDYETFLRSKMKLAEDLGVSIEAGDINPALKPHQQAIVRWMVEGGRRACFAAFGLGKSVMQLETLRLVQSKTGGRALIVCPLAVVDEFRNDAVKILGWPAAPKFIRRIEEASEPGIYLTNYETIRDGKMDPRLFDAASLDEAACLRGFGGTKTFREFMALFAGDDRRGMRPTSRGGDKGKRGDSVKYRFVATATPSPNEYIELLAYAAFLGIMDVGQAKTRFFKRDSTKADVLTIHPHKEIEFWTWLKSWGLFCERPSDVTGDADDDAGYTLPPLEVHWHEVKTDHSGAGYDRSGHGKLLKDASLGVTDAAREKRDSIDVRVEKLMTLLPPANLLGEMEQAVIWCDLNDEQRAVEVELANHGISYTSLYGNDEIENRHERMHEWKARKTTAFISKPMMYGAGVNLQQCHRMVFTGIGFKFCDIIQAIHRIYRFLQQRPCEVHFIYTEAERGIRRTIERKWEQHKIMVQKMTDLIREHGLSHSELAKTLTRKLGVERVEVSGERFAITNNDSVLETQRMKENSVHLVLSSIPFSTQYEYSPNYADFGHSEGNEEFFKQMDFLTPELLRILQSGRVCAIHVKDRIVPMGMTGCGFQTVYPFHCRTIEHFTRHGFGYLGMKTIVTDVVRENNQTYRLGWTEQCKDGTKMGVGMPEYLLLFRKPPTDRETSYADVPVVKSKKAYSRGRWQVDAHAFTRSSGNRLLTPEELRSLSHGEIFRMFRQHSLETVYDFEHHVKVAEELDTMGRLPVTFMLLQPQSWSSEVWSDITRMLTLNGAQSAKGKEMHLCPMQFDIADRVIEQFSMPGETVFDPFLGIGTVAYRAILKGRYGAGSELSPSYFTDACAYCKAAEEKVMMPDLFGVCGAEEDADGEPDGATLPELEEAVR